MFKNYIITAWRNLLKGKVFNAINVIGLTVAIACSTLLFLTVDFELSYDRFHENGGNMYQVFFTHNRATGVEKDTPMPEPITPALKAEFPDVTHITRMGNGGMLIRNGEKEIERRLKYVDKDFPEVFTLKARNGNVKTMLNDLSNIVLNEQVADALFGTENPVGKSVEVNYTGNGYERFTVSAVTEDLPWNSSFQMDAMIRFEHYRDYQYNLDKWDVGNHSVYLTLRDGTDQAAFEKKLAPFAHKYFKKEIADMKRDGARPDKNGEVFTVNLLPYRDVHFNTEIGGLDSATVSRIYLLTLLGTGIFILLIACINFINLNIARAFTRAREVGVRKTLGAGKNHLLIQFCLETALVCFIALVLGIVLALVLLTPFRTLFRSHIEMSMLLQAGELVSAAGIFLLVTFAAGFYPAWLMLRYKTVQVLKGNINATKPGQVRNVLLVTQFAISTLLIVCTLITWQQM
ncbi:MAG: ABC transporter permease, partial [Mucilaginibacter polytrichastri]|nr:ABC transporter permease [Mucilaginibacter polytrichastri]